MCVFIGADMDRDLIEQRLNAALLTPEEMVGGPEAWHQFEDPFAVMFRDREEDAIETNA